MKKNGYKMEKTAVFFRFVFKSPPFFSARPLSEVISSLLGAVPGRRFQGSKVGVWRKGSEKKF